MRLALALTFLLAGCVPTLTKRNEAVFSLTYDGRALRANAAEPLEYVVLRLKGRVSSAYCLDPACAPEPDGFVYLTLVDGPEPYPPDVALATGVVSAVEAISTVVGDRESYPARWP